MERARTLGCAALTSAVLAVAACGGDDSNAGGGPGGGDAGVDASGVDATTADAQGDSTSATDASDGAIADVIDAASPDVAVPDAGPLLACTTWRYPAPILLDDLSSADAKGFFNGELWVGEVAPDRVRIVTQPSGGPVFRVYGFDKAIDGGATTLLDGPTLARTSFVEAHHFDVGASHVTQVLVQAESADGSDDVELSAFLIDDAMSAGGPLPQAIDVGLGGSSVAVLPFDPSTLFAAVTYLSDPTPYYSLGVERATTSAAGTPAKVSTSPNVDDFLTPAIAHAGGSVYVFAGNGASVQGASAWTVPDTAVVPSPPPSRSFESGTRARFVDVAPATQAGLTNFAYYSAATDGSSATLRIGQVTDANLATVTAADLVPSRTDSDVSLQESLVGAQWRGDDLMIVGPGLPQGDGAPFAGMNLVWVRADGAVRADQRGAGALLQDRGAVRIAVAAPASIGASLARWNVAWVEPRNGGEVLLFNELECTH